LQEGDRGKKPPHGDSLPVFLALATKQLGDIGAGRCSQPRAKRVDDLLLLSDREPERRNVAHDVSAHRVRRVRRRGQRVRSNLPEINAGRPSHTLTIRVRDGQLDVSIVLRVRGRGRANASTRKRIGNRIDGDGLRIGVQVTCLPTGGPRTAGCCAGVFGPLEGEPYTGVSETDNGEEESEQCERKLIITLSLHLPFSVLTAHG